MKKLSLLLLFIFYVFLGFGQRPVVYDRGIHSLRLETKNGISALPILVKGSHDVLTVSFDDLTHEYRRFAYHIEHVGANFVADEDLFSSEYVQSDDDDLVIEDYSQSMNTSVLYNHYVFRLPNVGMRPLLSGNYRLVVSVENEEGDETVAFEAYFAVLESRVNVMMKGLTKTDLDFNQSHQQLEIEVGHNNLQLIDPDEELSIVVLQNDRWDNAVLWPKPSAQTGHSLKWNYCRQLIFPAGNEFRKFEQISTRYSGMFVDNVRFYDPYYYATLRCDERRTNYLYDEDQNGTFIYRAETAGDADTEADYMWFLFQLEADLDLDGDIYLSGLWTNNNFGEPYKMKYNAESKRYEALVFLKQGYYSYQYLFVPRGGKNVGKTAPFEGDFYQTENNYTVLVYYRPSGGRYDQLVGWRRSSFRPR